MSLSTETKALYTGIIDGILTVSDLKTISSKQIRKGIQSAVDYDITAQKEAINELIVERFDRVENMRKAPKSQPFKAAGSKEHVEAKTKREKDTEDESESDITTPPPKKSKRTTADEDAAFAARLQAEENSRGRATRGNASSKRQTSTKVVKKKAKSASRVKTTDDSDVGSGSDIEKTVKRTGAFHKLMMLSTPLADLLGEQSLSRPQTVKKIWEYVKERDLQNPDDKRQIICDEPMKAVFKQESVHMFTMNKILSKHLYPEEE